MNKDFYNEEEYEDYEEKDFDIYTDFGIEESLEEDEINANEEAFMKGYLSS